MPVMPVVNYNPAVKYADCSDCSASCFSFIQGYRIVIIINGTSGQLGTALIKQWEQSGDRVLGVDRSQMDLCDPASVRRVIERYQPRVMINCAAYTAVDLAEDEADLCAAINATAVNHLALACGEFGTKLVQISTDYVFGGAQLTDGPNHEDSPLEAQGVYAKTKLRGERFASECPNHLIIRTCGIYGVKPKPANFVESMIRLGGQRDELGVVDDQHCNPTSARAVARGTARLIDVGATGVFHVAASQATTWCEFAREIFRQAGMSTRVNPITTEQFGAKAPRPQYSVLDTSKFTRATGDSMPTVADDLAMYLADRQIV